MASPYAPFVHARLDARDDEVVALFRVRPARGFSMDEAMGRVASGLSVGTWASLEGTPARVERLAARATRAGDDRMLVAYPRALWEPGNIPQFLAGVGGNVFGMKAVAGLRLEDLRLPAWWLRALPGPGYGVPGVRRMLGVPERPILATVPKPKLGYTAAEHTRVAQAAWRGGIDLVKDDENLTDQRFNRFADRARRMRKARARVEGETGRTVSALLNVTAETDEARRRMRLLAELGWEFAMVDVVTTGWAALQTLRREAGDLGLAIHAHRAMHAMSTRDPRHGMSMPCLAKLLRAAGVDLLHVGTVVGKLESPQADVLAAAAQLRDDPAGQAPMRQAWAGRKAVVPVASGGLHPGIVRPVLDLLGRDCLVQAGGGVHGHPDGTEAGARALLLCVEAWAEGREDPAHDPAVSAALRHWGAKRPR